MVTAAEADGSRKLMEVSMVEAPESRHVWHVFLHGCRHPDGTFKLTSVQLSTCDGTECHIKVMIFFINFATLMSLKVPSG